MTARIDTTPKLKIQTNVCKALAVQGAANRLLKLGASVRDLVAGAEKLATMASDCLKNAEDHRRQAEEAEIEAARCRSGAERRESEAYELEEEASEYRQLIERLTREAGLNVQRLQAVLVRFPMCGLFFARHAGAGPHQPPACQRSSVVPTGRGGSETTGRFPPGNTPTYT